MSGSAIIAVEGGVCAGKTTLVERLARDPGLTTYPEYVEWLRTSDRPLPAGTPGDRLHGYLAIDEERHAAALASSVPILLDRSVLTLIGFEYVMAKLYLDTAWFDLRSIISQYNISRPAGIIIAVVGDETRDKIWIERGLKMNSIFVNRGFNDNLREFYYKVASRIAVVTVRPFEQSEDEIEKISRQFIQECRDRFPLNIEDLIDDLELY